MKKSDNFVTSTLLYSYIDSFKEFCIQIPMISFFTEGLFFHLSASITWNWKWVNNNPFSLISYKVFIIFYYFIELKTYLKKVCNIRRLLKVFGRDWSSLLILTGWSDLGASPWGYRVDAIPLWGLIHCLKITLVRTTFNWTAFAFDYLKYLE